MTNKPPAVCEPPDGGRVYRLDPKFLPLWIGCTGFFASIAGFSVWVALCNTDGSFEHPEQSAAFFGVFWLAFILLGMWFIGEWLKSRLVIGETQMTLTSLLEVKVIRWPEIARARWRPYPFPGCLELHSLHRRLCRVGFTSYAEPDRSEILMEFRRRIPQSIQADWDCFETHWKLEKQRLPSPWPSPRFLVLAAAFTCFGFAGVSLWAWKLELGARFAGPPLIGAAISASLFCWGIRKRSGGQPAAQDPGRVVQ